jgi:hypothetical protein
VLVLLYCPLGCVGRRRSTARCGAWRATVSPRDPSGEGGTPSFRCEALRCGRAGLSHCLSLWSGRDKPASPPLVFCILPPRGAGCQCRHATNWGREVRLHSDVKPGPGNAPGSSMIRIGLPQPLPVHHALWRVACRKAATTVWPRRATNRGRREVETRESGIVRWGIDERGRDEVVEV